MPTFLIDSPHSPEECLQALDNVLAMGYLTHFHWGCPGVHSGYMILDADSADEALMAVPTFIRHKARAIRLTQFTREQVDSFHHK